MADKKISDFATLTDVQSNDLLLVSSLNETYNTKVETLMDSIKGDGVVLFDQAQLLTNMQKTQARENINAADDDDLQDAIDNSVHVNDAQTLTDVQKARARENVSAASVADVNGKVAISQGIAQAGKAMIVGSDGNVTTGEAGVPEAVKVSLLELVRHVAYIDDQGQTYYNALYAALSPSPLIPDLSAVTPVNGYYFDDNDNEVASSSSWVEREYIPITAGQRYIWINGFSGNYYTKQDELMGYCSVYRVLFYRNDYSFISREVSFFSSDSKYIEQRYFEFDVPQDAEYIRLSWNDINLPGEIQLTIPDDLYAVHMVLCNPDDSNIDDVSALAAKMSIMRHGRKLDYYTSTWMKSVFNVLQGGSPEATGTHVITKSEKRITNRQSFLLQRGDILRFDGVKYGVRAERISDGSVEYTPAWVTDDADYVIGGVENG